MKNKETLKSAMDRRLSMLDELPSCRPALMQRIAQEEAPVMKNKRISFAIVFALVLVSLSVIALAAGLLLSPRVSAAQLASRELEKTYGVTEDMQSFFLRQEEELADGTYRVTWSSGGSLDYVLGIYTVEVKDGKAAASWSLDGKDTKGGYEAEAWGPEQMTQMMAVSSDAAAIAEYLAKAETIAAKNGYVPEEGAPATEEPEETYEEWYAKREANKNNALQAQKLTEEEMVEIAKGFIISNYELTEEQIGRLDLFTVLGAEDANAWYETVDGKPCFLVEYLLDKDDYTDELQLDPNYSRDNSYFKIYVNVETGVIEQYEYDAGVGGVG